MTITAGHHPRILVVCGPTGIGKTRIGITLARRFEGEIVGADSMQVYRRMDIGTAKPTPSERAQAPHHLIDVVDPDDTFDAADYARLAGAAVADIHRRGRLPIVVGGTGLYIKSLLYGLFPIPSPPQDIRNRLKAEAEEKGIDRLYNRLVGMDEEAATGIHPNDAFRIIRALEIQEAAGRPLSALRREQGFSCPRYSAFTIGLRMERNALYDRIDQRVEQMIVDGFLGEVRQLLNAGYSPELKAMQAIGYRHLVDFDTGRADWPETVRLLKRDTRRYAKRQLTWFRKDPDIHWIGPGDLDGRLPVIRAFLETAEKNDP